MLSKSILKTKLKYIKNKFFCDLNKGALKKTALYDYHKDVLKGKIVGFAGYEMPVQYTSIIEEHDNTRNNAGLFDVSHMGQIR